MLPEDLWEISVDKCTTGRNTMLVLFTGIQRNFFFSDKLLPSSFACDHSHGYNHHDKSSRVYSYEAEQLITCQ